MSRALVVIASSADRAKLCQWVQKAPWNTRVELKAPKRTLPQNDRMWAMLTDLAQQLPYHGVRLTAEDYKLIFLDALKRELGHPLRIVPNVDGTGFVNLGTSSSDLSKDEMSMLIELIAAFGAKHDVKFQDDMVAA